MQKLNFHKDKGDTEVFDKVTNEEPKEWTAVEFHKGAQEYVQENGEFEYEPPEPKGEVDWSARENEIEDAINEDFDRTYADYDKDVPFYKRWWFWLIAGLLLAALIIGILFKTGHMPGQFLDETTTAPAVTEVKLEGPLVEAADFVLPEDAKVSEEEFGWGVYQYGSLVRSYNGIGSNELGTWYIKDGLVDFKYTGYVKVNGTTYKVTEGKVDISNPVATDTPAATKTAPASNDGTVTGTTDSSQAQQPQGHEFSGGTEAQQDALASAVDYINQMAFSRDWLIAQLVSDGVDSNDAAWAADHCGANWNEQAYKKAQEYLKLTSFNHQDMVDQLLFEGFTADQAEYGASKAGL